MKGVLSIFICIVLFCGCSSKDHTAAAIQLRNDLLASKGCSFVSEITADYGDELYSFSMQCKFDSNGTLAFTVLKPDSIQGISGVIDADGGSLTFDDKVLAFEMLADNQITPVSAPWVMMKALRGGYITACSEDKNGYQIQLDDSYEENALRLDLWTDRQMVITHGEFLWDGRRILSLEITDFKLV